jgi:diketogulonate reductase-like aldo/keto reductase
VHFFAEKLVKGQSQSEAAVGDAMQEAFKAGAIKREDVFVTTKLYIFERPLIIVLL